LAIGDLEVLSGKVLGLENAGGTLSLSGIKQKPQGKKKLVSKRIRVLSPQNKDKRNRMNMGKAGGLKNRGVRSTG